MTRNRGCLRSRLGGWAVAAFLGLTAQLGAAPTPVDGEPVDAEAPATYRLPPVELAEVAPADLVFAETGPTLILPEPADDEWDDESDIGPPAPVVQSEWPANPAPPPAADLFPYTPTSAGLTTQLLPAVQRGYSLAQRGAFYAARAEFVNVLRRVAQARDAAAGADGRSRALAAGLRALDEADDFVPSGVQLEAELDVVKVASAHRTPVLRDRPSTLPHEAVALYHHYAQQQLAVAAAGEQAGSMALYGLGRISTQLAERRDDDVRYVRTAMTMYAAALAACPDNHLAANELGVLVCRTGRPAEAARLFERAIDFAPSATAYHNLAAAQQMLGLYAHAEANERQSQHLASLERTGGAVSRKAGIHWVSPAEMARVGQPAPWMTGPEQGGATVRAASNAASRTW